jgi:two-component system, NarL family, response regulator DevR
MSQRPAVSVVLVDDSQVVRLGLKALIGEEPRLRIVGEAATAAAGVDAARKLKPDVVLLDIRLPDGSGIDACPRILEASPNSRVLFLTSAADERLLQDGIRAGGSGYLLKEINVTALIAAILDVAAGKSVLDPAMTERVLLALKEGGRRPDLDMGPDALSPQERRILTFVAEGRTNKEIGQEMGLAEKTVKNYLANAFSKLNVTRRSQAAVLFSKHTGQS